MHFLPDRHWVLILPDNSDGSSHRVASGLLPDGNAEADGECGVVEVNDQLRQMQANPVELGPPGVCVQYLGVLLLAPSTFTCHTHKTPASRSLGTVHFDLPQAQNTNRYFSWYSPLSPETHTCYTLKTPTARSLGIVHFHLPHTQNTNRYFSWYSLLSPTTHKSPTGRFLGTVHFDLLHTHKTPTGTSLATVLFHLLHTQNTNRCFSWDSPLSPATHTKHQQVLLLVQSISACHIHKTPTGRFLGTVYFHLPRTKHQQVGFLVQSILTCYTHTKHQQVLLLLQSSFTYYTHKTPTGTSLATVLFHLLYTQNTNRCFSWDSPLSPATHTKRQQVGFLAQSTFTCYTHKTPTGTSLGTVHFHLPHTQNTSK